MMRKANHIIFARAKTSFISRPTGKQQYNVLHLSGRAVYKKGRDVPVLFILVRSRFMATPAMAGLFAV